MSSLFIIGNGFDIAHGIPTKYHDFREFIIKSYPEAIKYRDEVTFIEDIADVDTEEFSIIRTDERANEYKILGCVEKVLTNMR